ncbi:LPS export ABC transporter periplasmic protein LptC [Mucilaginibacter sp. L3T2-6]|uniref:LPS export ABC transporter periplasmic protein LptC n=1 Tax=Mucilaginibacter sp. L3T2-6 TaxID=3062491 RepID=UPI002676DD4A|nr:LPS export ABC transporter periplasmic protein LptC [Mucilaginibacter sp. L3T2-6]MDO3640691.1 LPS export ABC transporter periplasmic protein LptC [Mucilaginibacter sp. L3T2-6]MDV6212969.1 LPS export ABC transporter periplasmic protein LptC [Mucilaginibacter sp. L3T2-6]
MKAVLTKIFIYLPALFAGMFLFSSCENSLNDIKKISSPEEDKPISRSTGVDVIYSDSAKVKFHLTAPVMVDYEENTPKPYKEFPKGVKLVFYNDELKESGNVVSDYAIQREKENIVEFRKNVVATNADGQVFKSDELIYDMTARTFKSSKAVEITSPNGDIAEGFGFESSESMYPWRMGNTTGSFHVDEKDMEE